MQERTWSLNELYVSFDDTSFHNDLKTVKIIMEELKAYIGLEKEEKNLIECLKKEEVLSSLIEKLASFSSLKMSVNTNDYDAIKYDSVIENMLATFADTNASLNKWIASFDLDHLQDEYLVEHRFILHEIKQQNKYLLSEESESVLANLKTVASSSWSNYKNQLISSLKVSLDNQEYPLTEVLNMAYSKDKETRKKAYEAELKAYPSIEQGLASALNSIKGESIIEARLRGYASPLDRTLVSSRMSKETLEVLLKVIEKSLPLFEGYYKKKAEVLGYEFGLPWYEMYAPIIEVDSSYPYQKGSQFVVKQFHTFSKNLGNYAQQAIDKNWIDVYPRSGKVGGAFCNNLHSIKESRFLLNYGDEFGDVTTMAHELGHGFHGHCLNAQSILNAEYPMPIAETASTFCETIVKKAALKEATKEEQLAILESEISDCGQVIVDIYSRFLFESSVFKKREEGPLSVDEIKELMLEAQRKAYGNGLDHNLLHPYMWTWKPHYYSSDYAFYNFPYAFGLLLAKGLYGLYQNEGPSFASKYEEFLSLTGKMNLEDVGWSIGIDIQDEEFWQNSITMIEEDINLFYELLKEIG